MRRFWPPLMPHWPAACSGMRVVVLADLHVGSPWNGVANLRRVVERANAAQPDLVVLLGDYVIRGMRGGKFEQDLNDMDARPTAEIALKHKGVIVGVKSAHFMGPEWKPFEQAVIAGNLAHRPIMIDFGENGTERPLLTLLSKILRPGDIYTHMYSGLRDPSGE